MEEKNTTHRKYVFEFPPSDFLNCRVKNTPLVRNMDAFRLCILGLTSEGTEWQVCRPTGPGLPQEVPTALPESEAGEEQTPEECDAHLERARIALNSGLRTSAGTLKKTPSALKLKTKIRAEYCTVDQVCEALAHIVSWKEKSVLERLSRCWEWIDVDKRLAEERRPLAPSDELRSIAAALLKQ